MVALRPRIDKNDLFRLGVYGQLEGNFRIHSGSHRFTFYLQQISDIKDLVGRVVDVPVDDLVKSTYIQFSSKELYEQMTGLGFYRFGTHDWNVPRAYMQSMALRKEYLRGVIDALGVIDVDRTVPYVFMTSVNNTGVQMIQEIFGGNLHENPNGRSYLKWRGKKALEIGTFLDWKFYCYKNIRGAEIVKNMNWEKFIW